MPEARKPIPKTQKQLSNEYNGANAILGDPNLADPTLQGNNRAMQTSWQDDTVKPFTVGLQDIDEAVFYYFQNVIKPSIIQNGARIEVPVIYGSPERWKSVLKDGYIKDKSGAIMAPLLMFKRNSIAKNRSIGNKMDANFPNLYGTMKKKYDQKNFYSNFNVLNNRTPQQQFYAVAIPDYLTINYSCMVYTYYNEQLNKIVEAVEYASDSYWGDPQRYQFKAMIDSFTTQTELRQGEERFIRSNFDIRLYGYIIPDTIQKDLSSIKKYNNKTKLVFSLETDVNPEVFIPTTQVDDLGTNEIPNSETIDNQPDPRDFKTGIRNGE